MNPYLKHPAPSTQQCHCSHICVVGNSREWAPLTFNGLSFGEDGDGTFGHFLLAEDWRDFGSPAVWTHPDEMACLIGHFCCLKEPPLWNSGRVSEITPQICIWHRAACSCLTQGCRADGQNFVPVFYISKVSLVPKLSLTWSENLKISSSFRISWIVFIIYWIITSVNFHVLQKYIHPSKISRFQSSISYIFPAHVQW